MYRLTCLASLVCIVFALIGIVVPDNFKRYFAYLYFYLPFLWVLWFVTVVGLRQAGWVLKALNSWAVVNLAVLVVLSSFSIDIENFYQSKGIDLTILISYFPVIFPTCLIFSKDSIALMGLGEVIGTSGVLGAVSVWLEASMVVAMQSVLIVALLRGFMWRLEKGSR